MRNIGRIVTGLVLVGAFASPALAQSQHQLSLHLSGGAMSGFTDLSNGGYYDTKAGKAIAGGLSYQLNNTIALRADAAYGSSPIRFQGNTFGSEFNRVFMSAMVQVPLRDHSPSPYVMLGGGAAFLHHSPETLPDRTVVHGMGGGGVAFKLGKTPASVFVEGRMYVYRAKGLIGNRPDQSHGELDGSIGVGISYAIRM